MQRLLGFALFFTATTAAAAGQELQLWAGQATDFHKTDVLRLNYRRALDGEARRWWWPHQLQFGVGGWRVLEAGGNKQVYDVNVTPIWRARNSFGYVEGGVGAYLLSHTIDTENHRLPTALQFGSHAGAGVFLGKASLGFSLQHLSNAGIKKPNPGINFYLVTLGYSF